LRIITSIDDAKALVGEEVGLSDWVVIDQHRIDQFAEATADHQWIHVDTERATREMPEGKTIAHGYLTLALIPAFTGNFVHVENLARAINFQGSRLKGAETCRRVDTDLPGAARSRRSAQASVRC